MATAGGSSAPRGSASVPAEVISVLRAALVALGHAGHPVDANRLAARAWSSLRADSPEHAEAINRTMHVLARLETSRPVAPTRRGTGSPPASCSPANEGDHP